MDEDVPVAIGVAGHEVASCRAEGDVATVGRDGWLGAFTVPLPSTSPHRNSSSGTTLSVVDEDIVVSIGVAAHQVSSAGNEDDVSTVAGDGGLLAPSIPLSPPRPQRDASGGRGLPVSDEDVAGAIIVATHQVIGERSEGDVATIGGDGGLHTHIPAVGAVRGHRDSDGGCGLPVVDEDVGATVGITAHQVSSVGSEGDISAIGRDRRGVARRVSLGSRHPYRDPGGDTGLPVVNEDVPISVRATAHQVGCFGLEGNVATISGDRRFSADTIPLGSSRPHRDAGGDSGLPVIDEDVIVAIRVAGHEVTGEGSEGNVSTIAGERGLRAHTIPLGSI